MGQGTSIVEPLIQLGIGGGALAVMYFLMKPLIASLIQSQEKFAATLQEITRTVADLRRDMQEHFQQDKEADRQILLHLQTAEHSRRGG